MNEIITILSNDLEQIKIDLANGHDLATDQMETLLLDELIKEEFPDGKR